MVEKLVPKIRFSRFTDEWIKIPAGEIFKNVSNKNHDGTLPILAVTQDKGVVPRDSIDFDIKTSEKSVKTYKIIEPGDYVISLRSFQGGIEYSYIKGICSPAYTILKPKKDIFDDFYKFYLKKDEFISRLNYAVIGIRDGKQISYKDFSEIKIPYTSVPEQKRISEFLNVIDNKINLLTRKYENYQNFKKYLMQQIFTQKLRFDFNDDWKQYKLKNLLSVKSSNISINQLENNTGDYPLYGASGFLKNIDFCEMDVDYISIVKDGSGVGNLSYHERNSSIVNTSQYLLPKKDFNIHFLYYFLQTLNLKKYINGSSIPHIYFKDYCIEKVSIPSLSEQNQIGRLFLDIDKKLENLNKKIELTNEFKKSLLQQMFNNVRLVVINLIINEYICPL